MCRMVDNFWKVFIFGYLKEAPIFKYKFPPPVGLWKYIPTSGIHCFMWSNAQQFACASSSFATLYYYCMTFCKLYHYCANNQKTGDLEWELMLSARKIVTIECLNQTEILLNQWLIKIYSTWDSSVVSQVHRNGDYSISLKQTFVDFEWHKFTNLFKIHHADFEIIILSSKLKTFEIQIWLLRNFVSKITCYTVATIGYKGQLVLSIYRPIPYPSCTLDLLKCALSEWGSSVWWPM